MTEFGWTISRLALTSSLVFGAMSAGTLAGDLSRYRNFQLGSDLPTVAKQAGAAGLTAGDMVEAISATYGTPTKPTGPAELAPALYGDQQEVRAEWQDSQYRYDLIIGTYGPASGWLVF